MDDYSKQVARMVKRKLPDMSHIKPSTEHAVSKMVRNLRMAAKTVK